MRRPTLEEREVRRLLDDLAAEIGVPTDEELVLAAKAAATGEPRPEPLRVLERRQRPPRGDERLLEHVARVALAAEAEDEEPVQPLPVRDGERLERGVAPELRAADDLREGELRRPLGARDREARVGSRHLLL